MIKIPICIIWKSQNIQKLLHILSTPVRSARVIGGAIRNIMLGQPVNDIDITTQLLPEEVMSLLKLNNIRCYATGIKFGTVTAIIDEEKFEITTLRQDIQCYGRHAKVQFSNDYFEDAKRRDFTINALSYSLEKNLLYDYFNGLQDLKDRKVLFIGDSNIRIQEDVLRILRFFRFSSYYARSIDQEGYQSCAKNAKSLTILSKERIIQELNKIIVSPNAYRTLVKMVEINITHYIGLKLKLNLEIFKNIIIIAQNKYILLNHAMLYSALLSGNVIQDLKAVLFNLRFSKAMIKKIVMLCTFLSECQSKNAIFLIRKYWAYGTDNINDYIDLALLLECLSEKEANIVKQQVCKSRSKLPVNGYDLKELGLTKQDIQKTLLHLNDAWISSNFTLNKQELINLLKSWF
ncbi:poly A polymerase head domain protein [Orientia chuto str. Dubai]|uniref:Poly A polymerase head domain protein n=1 Tax=Orientia chuto str. Dubai TaxID=1359168 RepID=A0A0F3MMS9_9RICK|nr:CCA tRNA nucleotidyltransferase [Candidatus Orientia mediorientalis]KJV56767.1 poly A polymerase head domain protein [Orientia chuto str. Dubai]